MTDHFEIIVVDDMSTDESVAAVEPFLADPRVHLLKRSTNGGEWAARATGVGAATGEWVVFIDSDDEFLPGGLTRLEYLVNEHGSDVVRLGFEFVYEDGTKAPFPELYSQCL